MAMTEWFNRRARKRNDIERKAQVAFATFQRLNQIYSVTLSIESHLREGIERAQQARSYNFLTTQALQRMAAPIYFPVEEIWTLTQIGGADLGNSVGSLDHAFNLLLNALDDYGVKRDVLMNEMPPPTRAEGYKGTMEVDETEILRLTPQIGALELAIEQLHPMAQRLALEAFEALCKVVGAESLPLGKSFEVGLVTPDGQKVVIKAGNPKPRLDATASQD
ncbi:hypothetical protein [Novosphingobium sp. NDB2Meth1]|uniref:hypothetical protein n=1 Tax=Novosphingobium sp. NDB2Meth1 TaxID=1892847 RepID=UPI000AC74D1A|nr:hypothetical protein [Novosphingobium sp. NDB2Meth1]